MAKNKHSGFSGLEISCLATGILLPIPIVGEAILAGGLYKAISDSNIVSDNPLAVSATSLAVAGLARMQLYSWMYIPMLNFAKNLAN